MSSPCPYRVLVVFAPCPRRVRRFRVFFFLCFSFVFPLFFLCFSCVLLAFSLALRSLCVLFVFSLRRLAQRVARSQPRREQKSVVARSTLSTRHQTRGGTPGARSALDLRLKADPHKPGNIRLQQNFESLLICFFTRRRFPLRLRREARFFHGA